MIITHVMLLSMNLKVQAEWYHLSVEKQVSTKSFHNCDSFRPSEREIAGIYFTVIFWQYEAYGQNLVKILRSSFT